MRTPHNGNYPVTQIFNDTCCRASYTRFGMLGHNGTDWGMPVGSEVVAAHAGKVYAGSEPGGYGNYIFITAPDGGQTVYGHLQKHLVSTGQQVQEGQVIGLSGNTGNSTGAHLHFGYRPANSNKNNGFLGYIDPPITKQGGNVVIGNGENWYARLNQLHVQVLGTEFPRKDFAWWVGKDTLQFIEAVSDQPTAHQRAQIATLAIRDNWQGQITTLQKQFADATALANTLNERLVKSENDTKTLTSKVEVLQKKLEEMPAPPEKIEPPKVVTPEIDINVFTKILDYIVSIFKGGKK